MSWKRYRFGELTLNNSFINIYLCWEFALSISTNIVGGLKGFQLKMFLSRPIMFLSPQNIIQFYGPKNALSLKILS